jgi:hypothetical protein
LTRRYSTSFIPNDRLGATNAIKRTLQMLLDGDELRELPKSQMTDKYQTNGRGFAISNPATFIKLR